MPGLRLAAARALAPREREGAFPSLLRGPTIGTDDCFLGKKEVSWSTKFVADFEALTNSAELLQDDYSVGENDLEMTEKGAEAEVRMYDAPRGGWSTALPTWRQMTWKQRLVQIRDGLPQAVAEEEEEEEDFTDCSSVQTRTTVREFFAEEAEEAEVQDPNSETSGEIRMQPKQLAVIGGMLPPGALTFCLFLLLL